MLEFLKKQKQKNIEKANYAGSSRRFFAYSLDVFLVMMIRYLIIVACFFIWLGKNLQNFIIENFEITQDGIAKEYSNHEVVQKFVGSSVFFEMVGVLIFVFLVGSLYWVLMNSSKNQGTLGKMLMKIIIVDEENKRLSLKKSIYRYLVGLIPWGFSFIIAFSIMAKIPSPFLLIVSIFVIAFWYETKLFKRSTKAMHDIICGTKVVNRYKAR